MSLNNTTRGILNPADGFVHFSLQREPPASDLACFVERFWSVQWDLEGRPPFEQEILPYPCINVSFSDGHFEVHGPGTRRFSRKLSGRGCVYGTKFRPAGFFAFACVPMRALVDRVVSLDEAIGHPPPVLKSDDPGAVRDAMEALLRCLAPPGDENIALVNRLVATAQQDRSISQAEDLASLAGVSLRSLHRLFERYVGVGPKWIVRRSRVQEAAERVARGERVDWAATSQELGYHDQAHLIRDFRAQVGFTPAAYARHCAASTAQAASRGQAPRSPLAPEQTR